MFFFPHNDVYMVLCEQNSSRSSCKISFFSLNKNSRLAADGKQKNHNADVPLGGSLGGNANNLMNVD